MNMASLPVTSPMEKIKARLEIKNGMALCPAHDDRNPSLSVTVASDGRVLLNCHAGCKTEDIVKALGLTLADLFPSNEEKRPKDTRREIGRRVHADPGYKGYRKIIIKYDDNSKTTFFERFENGTWIKGLDGLKQTLYNLDALKTDGIKYLSESEKDADVLNSLGFSALSFGGANNWKSEYANELAGYEVIILPHNDEPGRKVAEQATHDLKAVGCRVKVIPGGTWGDHSGADVSDWIEIFQDKEAAVERLSIMSGEASDYQAPKVMTIDDAVLTIDQFRALDIPVRQNLLLPWLKEASIIFISGWRGCGKTWLALSILQAISTGGILGPWKNEYRVPTLFLDGELPAGDVDERIKALGMQHNSEYPVHILSDAYANLLGLPRAHLANDKWRRDIKRILTTRHIRCWVIDNISSLASGLDENSKKDWDPINQWLLELRFAGITNILLHHTGKGGVQRGTSAREDNADCSILLKKPHDYLAEDGCRFIVIFDKARVTQKELHLIGDTEFQLIEKQEGSVWRWGNVQREKSKEILRMIDDGSSYDAICDALSITKGYISQVKTKAIKDGYMNKQGKLTQQGVVYCQQYQDEGY
jgi:hypothetical protein